jgi:mono/diheme cytochrome c family protein
MKQKGLTGWLPLFFIVFAINPIFGQWGNWLAPDSADNLINPFSGDKSALIEGKQLFDAICFVCHGNQGKGDGINAANLERPPANLTSELVQRQSDGVLFWKISEGNPPMLSFKSSLSEDQRWKMVNYIRELAVLFPDKPEEKEVVKEGSKKSILKDQELTIEKETVKQDSSIADNANHDNDELSNDTQPIDNDSTVINNPNEGGMDVTDKHVSGDYSLQYMLISIFAGTLTVVLILFSMIYIVLKY